RPGSALSGLSGRFFGLGAATPATSPPASTPAMSTAPIETYQRIAALPSNEDDGDMQIASRKALKSLVLHIRVSAAHEQQVIRPCAGLHGSSRSRIACDSGPLLPI